MNIPSLKTIQQTKIKRQNKFKNEELIHQYILVDIDKFKSELEIFTWRNKTQFPIFPIKTYNVIEQNQDNIIIQCIYDNQFTRITNVTSLPFFKLLYLIKQCLVGFDRLKNTFGFFQISSNMIIINRHGKIKVWMNQNLSDNDVQYPIQKNKNNDQNVWFFSQVCKIIEMKSIKTLITKKFFKRIYQMESIVEILNYINYYANRNRISIPAVIHLQNKLYLRSQKKLNNSQTIKIIKSFSPSIPNKKEKKQKQLFQRHTFTFGGDKNNIKKRLNQVLKYEQKSIFCNQVEKTTNRTLKVSQNSKSYKIKTSLIESNYLDKNPKGEKPMITESTDKMDVKQYKEQEIQFGQVKAQGCKSSQKNSQKSKKVYLKSKQYSDKNKIQNSSRDKLQQMLQPNYDHLQQKNWFKSIKTLVEDAKDLSSSLYESEKFELEKYSKNDQKINQDNLKKQSAEINIGNSIKLSQTILLEQ